MSTTEPASPARPGRRRDVSKDAAILDAALDVLAEAGYDGLTIDAVAARAGAARATVYRRWASKTELVLDAVARLDTEQIEGGSLPDTGTLRNDLLALLRPQTVEQDSRRIRIVGGLASLSRAQPDVARAAVDAAVAPWVRTLETLIERSIARGEYPPGDVARLAAVVPRMVTYEQAIRNSPVSHDDFVGLIDDVLLAALRGGSGPHRDG